MGNKTSSEYKIDTIAVPEYVQTYIKNFNLISDKNSAIHWLKEYHKIYEDINSKFISLLLADNSADFKTVKFYHNKINYFVLFIFEYTIDGIDKKKSLWLLY